MAKPLNKQEFLQWAEHVTSHMTEFREQALESLKGDLEAGAMLAVAFELDPGLEKLHNEMCDLNEDFQNKRLELFFHLKKRLEK